MKKYLGKEIDKIIPMTNYEFNRCIGVSNNKEDIEFGGYALYFKDNSASWIENSVFNEEFDFKSLDFGKAVKALKQGNKVSRYGWNGKGMYLTLVQGYPVNGFLNSDDVNGPIYAKPNGEPVVAPNKGGQMLSHIVMKTAGDSKYWGEGYSDYVPWLASQTDILSEDWMIID